MNALKLDSFKEINEKNFKDKNGIVSKYTELDTGIDKFRVKYKALKQEWSRITYCVKNGSGVSSDKEPRWFKHLNSFFCEANETISLSSSAADTSFVNEPNENHNASEGSSYSESENLPEYSEDETQIGRDAAPPSQKKKTVAAPRKISKQMRSNKQVLIEIAQFEKFFWSAE